MVGAGSAGARAGRRLVVLAAALTVALAATQSPAQERASDSGWKTVTAGMRHFTGLTCPDQVATLNRIRVLTGSVDRIAGCIYQNAEGVSAIVRSHPSGSGATAARDFRERYSAAGFPLLETSGAAAAGISFLTGSENGDNRCETLWRFRTGTTDYTLWMVYSLPGQEAEIGPLVTAFARLLAEKAP
jgi:hypothetical protein